MPFSYTATQRHTMNGSPASSSGSSRFSSSDIRRWYRSWFSDAATYPLMICVVFGATILSITTYRKISQMIQQRNQPLINHHYTEHIADQHQQSSIVEQQRQTQPQPGPQHIPSASPSQSDQEKVISLSGTLETSGIKPARPVVAAAKALFTNPYHSPPPPTLPSPDIINARVDNESSRVKEVHPTESMVSAAKRTLYTNPYHSPPPPPLSPPSSSPSSATQNAPKIDRR